MSEKPSFRPDPRDVESDPSWDPFARYQRVVDDWSSFVSALARPLPICIWTNSGKTTAAELSQILAGEGVQVAPVTWKPETFRWAEGGPTPGTLWPFLGGLYHVQEEASQLPVQLLAPQRGERILDLCAAPGGKTAQLAVAVGEQGTVVANDLNYHRMRALRQTLERLSLANVCTTVLSGANYPREAGSFDAVLVDVPCSCEGTSRKNPKVMAKSWRRNFDGRMSSQQALLRRGLQLCRPGGRVVYATCTYAPEENEAIVDALLKEFSGAIELREARLPGLRSTAGLTEFGELAFSNTLTRTMRVWPHQNDTGGFFVAVFDKSDHDLDVDRGTTPATPPIAPDGERHELESRLSERFGFSRELLSGYDVLRAGKEGLYVVARGHEPPAQPRADAIGLFIMRTNIRHPKLTTAGALLLGSQATRHVVELDREQLARYLRRQTVELRPAQLDRCAATGFVIVRHRSHPIGTAFLRWQGAQQSTELESLYPKAWALR